MVDSTPNSSITTLSTDKFGTGTTGTCLQMIENTGLDCRTHTDGEFQFRCETQQAMPINKTGVSLKTLFVVGNIITNSNAYSANTTSKTLMQTDYIIIILIWINIIQLGKLSTEIHI